MANPYSAYQKLTTYFNKKNNPHTVPFTVSWITPNPSTQYSSLTPVSANYGSNTYTQQTSTITYPNNAITANIGSFGGGGNYAPQGYSRTAGYATTTSNNTWGWDPSLTALKKEVYNTILNKYKKFKDDDISEEYMATVVNLLRSDIQAYYYYKKLNTTRAAANEINWNIVLNIDNLFASCVIADYVLKSKRYIKTIPEIVDVRIRTSSALGVVMDCFEIMVRDITDKMSGTEVAVDAEIYLYLAKHIIGPISTIYCDINNKE